MGNQRWKDEEKEIVKKYFDPKKASESSQYIVNNFLFHRTVQSILYCANRMELRRKLRDVLWCDKEIKRLSQLAEKVPFPELYQQMKYLWSKHGLPVRTPMAVRQEMIRLGYSVTSEGCLTIPDLCDGLRCGDKIIYRWFNTEKFRKILKPCRMKEARGSEYYIKLYNFVEFAREYPSEIAKCHPDILWPVTILTSD